MPPMGHLTCKVAEHAVIFNPEGKALMIKGAWNGHWMLPGGRLEEQDQPIQSLLREIQEEVGLVNVKIGAPFFTNRWKNPSEGDVPAKYSVVYLAKIDEINPVIEPTDEQNGFEWITADQIDDGRPYVHEHFKTAAKKAFEIYSS
jgi:ADP-ribose pyrophosphatase YjhB (NUDIX family)